MASLGISNLHIFPTTNPSDSTAVSEDAPISAFPASAGSLPRSALFQRFINSMTYGVCLFDSAQRIAEINAYAQQFFGLWNSRLTVGDQLTPSTLSAQFYEQSSQLLEAIKKAQHGKDSFLLLSNGATSAVVSISPLKLSESETLSLVSIERLQLCDSSSLQAFGRLFDLTPAETRVLETLQQDLEPIAVAKILHISVSTVRSHIKALISKTESDNLRSLLMRIAKLPPLISATPHSRDNLFQLH